MSEKWVYYVVCIEDNKIHRLSPTYTDPEEAQDFGRRVRSDLPHWDLQVIGKPEHEVPPQAGSRLN